jgi:hypothetical protein
MFLCVCLQGVVCRCGNDTVKPKGPWDQKDPKDAYQPNVDRPVPLDAPGISEASCKLSRLLFEVGPLRKCSVRARPVSRPVGVIVAGCQYFVGHSTEPDELQIQQLQRDGIERVKWLVHKVRSVQGRVSRGGNSSWCSCRSIGDLMPAFLNHQASHRVPIVSYCLRKIQQSSAGYTWHDRGTTRSHFSSRRRFLF